MKIFDKRLFLLAAAIFLLRGTAAFAQVSIQGRVVGAAGEPVREARVRLETQDGAVAFKTKSDPEGRFLFTTVEAGNYRLIGEAKSAGA